MKLLSNPQQLKENIWSHTGSNVNMHTDMFTPPWQRKKKINWGYKGLLLVGISLNIQNQGHVAYKNCTASLIALKTGFMGLKMKT